MEYRPVTDPLNPEYYHLFVKPKPWEEGIRLLSLDDSKTDPLIDPVKNPILTRVIDPHARYNVVLWSRCGFHYSDRFRLTADVSVSGHQPPLFGILGSNSTWTCRFSGCAALNSNRTS
jgi:hypothetical protein